MTPAPHPPMLYLRRGPAAAVPQIAQGDAALLSAAFDATGVPTLQAHTASDGTVAIDISSPKPLSLASYLPLWCEQHACTDLIVMAGAFAWHTPPSSLSELAAMFPSLNLRPQTALQPLAPPLLLLPVWGLDDRRGGCDGPILAFARGNKLVAAVPAGGPGELALPLAALMNDKAQSEPEPLLADLLADQAWLAWRALVGARLLRDYPPMPIAQPIFWRSRDLLPDALVLLAAVQLLPDHAHAWLGDSSKSAKSFLRFLENAGIAFSRDHTWTAPDGLLGLDLAPFSALLTSEQFANLVRVSTRRSAIIPPSLTIKT